MLQLDVMFHVIPPHSRSHSVHQGHFKGTFEQGDVAVYFSGIEYVNRTMLGQCEFL